ncbi:MAG: ThuA domain-containing protein [Clostridia bacterium]|nr:ThuA domain-containing protein [Clostridia bacterium]
MNVLIYNEFRHEREPGGRAKEVYQDGMHAVIAGFLEKDPDISVKTVTLDTVDEITADLLKETDVIIWWGHCHHNDVPDEVAELVQNAVLNGMGAVFLHSAHKSKPFMRLMGTSCSLIWRESNDMERVWVSAPYHPIAFGLDRFFEIPADETYGEPFGIPTPDETVFIGWFTGGEVFRSGCTWQRGWGKVFYFQPGHETFPVFYDPNVQTVIRNAVRWTAPERRIDDCMDCPCLPKAHKGAL